MEAKQLDYSLLLRELDFLAKRTLEKYPTINSGGCGVFAEFVAKELKALGVKGIQIKVESWNKPLYSLHYHLTKGSNRRGKKASIANLTYLDFRHVVVSFLVPNGNRNRRIYYDSLLGTSCQKDPCYYPGSLRLTELSMVNQQPIWNKIFDRRKIPKVEQLVKEYFSCLKD